MNISINVFKNGEMIPVKYTCDDENSSPLLIGKRFQRELFLGLLFV
jgi:hypothetical protein